MIGGMYTPNFGQMGTENLPSGNGPAIPYGATPTGGGAPMVSTGSMQGPASPAFEGTAYRPVSGRADRLSANIVGGSDFDNLASGGYSGGATQRM